MMNKEIELHPRMDRLDEAIISSLLQHNRTKPQPRFPWMTPEKSNVPKAHGTYVTDTNAVHEPSPVAETYAHKAYDTYVTDTHALHQPALLAETTDARIERNLRSLRSEILREEYTSDRSDDRKFSLYKERDDAELISPSYGQVRSRYEGYSMQRFQRPFQPHAPGQAVNNQPPVGPSAICNDTTSELQSKFGTTSDNNKARPPIPRTNESNVKYSDTHHTFPTAQRSKPVSRQPVTRMMPGLRDSSHNTPRGTGNVGLTLSHGALPVSQCSVKETLSAAALSTTNARPEKTQKRDEKEAQYRHTKPFNNSPERNTRMDTETVESQKEPNKQFDKETPYKKRYGFKISVVDEPKEARQKKIKKMKNTISENDLILEDISSGDEEELTVLGDVNDWRTGHTKPKQPTTDRKSASRYASSHTRHSELYADHDQGDTFERDTVNRKTDADSHSSDDDLKGVVKRRRWKTSSKSRLNKQDTCANDEIDKHKTQQKERTCNTSSHGKRNCDIKDRRDLPAEQGLVKEINDTKERKKKVKRKWKSKNTNFAKVYPIDDGSETIVRDSKQLDKIAAMFCVESEVEAAKRRANGNTQQGRSNIRKVEFYKINPSNIITVLKAKRFRSKNDRSAAMVCVKSKEQFQKQRAILTTKAISDDDDGDDNFRPGVWNCNLEFKTPTTSEKVNLNVAHINRGNDTNIEIPRVDTESDRNDDDDTDGNASCVSGIRNFFRRIFKIK